MKTHRCIRSLEAQASIRQAEDGLNGWILAKADYDFEYLRWYYKKFGRIRFCPYCGERLDSTLSQTIAEFLKYVNDIYHVKLTAKAEQGETFDDLYPELASALPIDRNGGDTAETD